MFRKSRTKEIGPEDLYQVLQTHKSDLLGDRLYAAWDQEVQSAGIAKREPSLLKATLRVFGWKIALLGIYLLLVEALTR